MYLEQQLHAFQRMTFGSFDFTDAFTCAGCSLVTVLVLTSARCSASVSQE